MATHIATREQPTFLKKNHELSKTLKLLQSCTKDAITVLQKGLESEDQKIATTCAKDLLGFEVQIAKMISDDQLQRQVAETRYSGKTTNLTTSEDDNIPRLDFNTVRVP